MRAGSVRLTRETVDTEKSPMSWVHDVVGTRSIDPDSPD